MVIEEINSTPQEYTFKDSSSLPLSASFESVVMLLTQSANAKHQSFKFTQI